MNAKEDLSKRMDGSEQQIVIEEYIKEYGPEKGYYELYKNCVKVWLDKRSVEALFDKIPLVIDIFDHPEVGDPLQQICEEIMIHFTTMDYTDLMLMTL